jgi:hypothetical protein
MRRTRTCCNLGKVRPNASSSLGKRLTGAAVTPGITAQEYYDRRVKLAKALPKGSIAVLAASDVKYRSGAVFYKFHQDPDFLYLTGTVPRVGPYATLCYS